MSERKILFRGKRVDSDEWVIGGSIIQYSFNAEKVISLISSDVESLNWELPANKIIPETLGRYTGLTDRNGTKIFEGDIVRHYNSIIDLQRFEIGLIYWEDETCKFMRTTPRAYCIEEICKLYEYEVIGNIHDNPELMKGE